MSGFSLLDVQASVYALLAGNSFLTSRGWRTLDHVGEREVLPYIVLDSDSGTDNSTKDRAGMIVQLELHFWSDYRGFKLAKEAMREVYDRIHMRSVVLADSLHSVKGRISFVSVFRDQDGIRRHGVMKAEFLTYEASSVGIEDEENRFLEIPEEP